MTRLLLLAALVAGFPAQVAAQAPAAPTARPLSLGDALRLGEGASEAVGIARAGVQRARGQVVQTRSGYLPQLTGSATYTRTLRSQFSALNSGGGPDTATAPAPSSCNAFRPDPSLPVGERLDSLESSVTCLSTVNPFASFRNLPFGRAHEYNFGLSFSQTLFDRPLMGRIRAAAAGRTRAEIGLDAQRAQLTLDVASAYFDAVLTDRLLAIAESTLVQADRTLHEVELGRQVGNQPEFDLLRARVSRENEVPVVIRRRTDRDQAMIRLKQLLDLPLEEELALTTGLDGGEIPELNAVLPPKPDTLPDDRAPVRQAAQDLRAAEASHMAAGAERLPSLQLTSTFAQIGYPNTAFDLGNTNFISDWTVALRMQVPLFTGGRLRGDRMVAGANLEESRLRLKQTREQAAQDSRNQLAQLEAAQASWDASVGVVDQATRAYQIAEVRYREGISTQTELADSRLLLQQAEANQAQAARDLQLARVRVALLRDLPIGAGR